MEGNGLLVAASAMQGWRIDMEDAHKILLRMPGAADANFFAVFDGHGGSLVSKTAADRIVERLQATREWKEDGGRLDPAGLSAALRQAFLDLDDEMRRLPDVVRGDDHSGATAISCMVTGSHVICANAGDSRSILVRDDKAVEMSEDHKPYLDGEAARIEKAGGTVIQRRVNGDLAVSRALGDYVYKHRRDLPAEAQQVSAEPELRVQPRSAGDQFLVLACDGIWDVMSNDQVAEYLVARARARHAEGAPLNGPWLETLCDDLIDECLRLGSRDNMSCVIVAFEGAVNGTAGSFASARAAAGSEGGTSAAAAAGGGSSATAAAPSTTASGGGMEVDSSTGSASSSTGSSGGVVDLRPLSSTLPPAEGTGSGTGSGAL